jgi:hypothetical protein
LGELIRFFLHIDYILALWVPDLSEGQEKDILGLRRNSLTRRPLNFYPPPKEEGWVKLS